MGQCCQPWNSDAGKRLDFAGTDSAALDAAQHKSCQCPGGGRLVHNAAFGLFHIVSQTGRGGRKALDDLVVVWAPYRPAVAGWGAVPI